MIIWLRGALSSGDSAVVEGVENLAAAALNGAHLVGGSRETIEGLSRHPELSIRARAYFRFVSQKLTQIGSRVESANKITVDLTGLQEDDGNVIEVGRFSNVDYCEKSQLLTENLTDFEVLSKLAELWAADYFPGLHVCLRAVNGGGSTMPQMLRHVDANPSGPVLCVVDSDRGYPGAGLGDTAKATRRQMGRLKDAWRAHLHVIEQRELENLIPSDLRRACCETLSAEVIAQVGILDGLHNIYADYICLKKGDSSCRIICSAITNKQTQHLGTLSTIACNDFFVSTPCGTCPRSKCFKTPPLGVGFLQRVASRLKSDHVTSDISNWSADLVGVVRHVAFFGLTFGAQRL